jgi:molybdate transport system ATP-binding protein
MTTAPLVEKLEARLRGRVGRLDLDVALTAPKGSVTALVGASGSGKTTLLRALAGLQRLEGEVRLGDAIWQDRDRFLPAYRRGVGFVFHQSQLFPHLTVRGNLDYAVKRARVGLGRFEAVVALLGLAHLLDRGPAGLSGGERQRAAIGRALLTAPTVLLLDEPLSGVDAAVKAALLPELKAVFAALAIPILYVSHDGAEVAKLADRRLLLHDGQLTPMADMAADDGILDGLSSDRIAALAKAALHAGLG